jgi:hypothetical protein
MEYQGHGEDMVENEKKYMISFHNPEGKTLYVTPRHRCENLMEY